MCLLPGKVAGIWLARRPSNLIFVCRVSPSSDRQWPAVAGPHKIEHILYRSESGTAGAFVCRERDNLSQQIHRRQGVALCSLRAGRRSCGSKFGLHIISLRGQRALQQREPYPSLLRWPPIDREYQYLLLRKTHGKGIKPDQLIAWKHERSGGSNTTETTPVGAGTGNEWPHGTDCNCSSGRYWKWHQQCKAARWRD